uniref:Sodium/solute symporter n=1 Tax=Macrostomum lignano TaxID=282301 RepID=A0A1I8JSG6_9PLAT
NGMALERTSNSFHWADYVILVLSLLISCSVGIYFALSGEDNSRVSHGDRSMRLVPVSVSLVASFLSAILILGHPAEIYLNGIGFHFHLLGVTVAYVLSAVLFVRLFYPLRLTSVFEYLDKRFNSKLARCIGTILSLILYVTNNAVRREYVIAACGIIGTFYTLLGGMKAVVWVDAIQAGIMLIGVLSVAIKAVVDSGGLASVWQLNMDYDRIQLPSWTLDPRERHSMWGMVLGSAVYWLSSIGVSQAAVQRLCSLPRVWCSARRPLPDGQRVHLSRHGGVQPLRLRGLRHPRAGWADTNQIVTYYVMERMNVPGFPGLFTSALLAAALSSVSSSLSSASTIAWTDLLRPYACKNLTEGQATFAAKVLVALFGLIGIAIAYLAAQLGGTIIQAVSTFLGAIIGPSLGLILLASIFPSANWFGASISPFAGVAFGIWIGAGSYANKKQLVKLAANVTGCNTLAAGSFAATNSSETEAYRLLFFNYKLCCRHRERPPLWFRGTDAGEGGSSASRSGKTLATVRLGICCHHQLMTLKTSQLLWASAPPRPAPFSLEAGKCVFVNTAQSFTWCSANRHCASIVSDLAEERGTSRSGWQLVKGKGILPLNDSLWRTGDPNSSGGNQDCIGQHHDAVGKLSDNVCSGLRGLACEFVGAAQPHSGLLWQRTPFKRTSYNPSSEFCHADLLQVKNAMHCVAAGVRAASCRHVLYNSKLRACRLLLFTDAQAEAEIETSADWVKFGLH